MVRYAALVTLVLALFTACDDDNYLLTEDVILPTSPTVIEETEELFLSYAHSSSDVELLDGLAVRAADDGFGTFAFTSGEIECGPGGSVGFSYGGEASYPQFGIILSFTDETNAVPFVGLSDIIDGEVRNLNLASFQLYDCGDYQRPTFELISLTDDVIAGSITGDFFYMNLPLVDTEDLMSCANWSAVENLTIEFALPYTDC